MRFTFLSFRNAVNTKDHLVLDQRRQTISSCGLKYRLQDKSWQVVELLIAEAPRTVSREQLIEKVWNGNWRTGEKGLNQAIWSIRKALSDSSRLPKYIRTWPRLGYQWVGPADLFSGKAAANKSILRFVPPKVATAVILAISVTAAAYFSPGHDAEESPPGPGGTDNLALSTFLDSNNVVVDFEEGCRLIINPSGTKVFANPVISSDRHSVAFSIYENSECKTVMVQLDDLNKREEFDFCPVAAI